MPWFNYAVPLSSRQAGTFSFNRHTPTKGSAGSGGYCKHFGASVSCEDTDVQSLPRFIVRRGTRRCAAAGDHVVAAGLYLGSHRKEKPRKAKEGNLHRHCVDIHCVGVGGRARGCDVEGDPHLALSALS